MTFELKDLQVAREGTPIVKGVSLTLAPGELVVLRGKNGSGKSTLLNAVMGHPKYVITAGSILVDGDDVTALPPHERARKGVFLALQQPPEVAGVSLKDFVRTSLAAQRGERPRDAEMEQMMTGALGAMRLDPRFASRSVNEGSSGGEKKRGEIVQLLALQPKYALLDEPDSGLDPAARQYVADAVLELRQKGTAFLVVSHAEDFVALLQPDRVLTMSDGVIAS